MTTEWKAGDVIEVPYPFVRTTYTEYDEGGSSEVLSWKPGIEYELRGDSYSHSSEAVADGTGKQILTVIDIHKPGKYPTRIFYTRQWVSPDGKTFGKSALRITTLDAFRRRARGFMSHDPYFEVHPRAPKHNGEAA